MASCDFGDEEQSVIVCTGFNLVKENEENIDAFQQLKINKIIASNQKYYSCTETTLFKRYISRNDVIS